MTLPDRATPSLYSTNFSGYRVYQALTESLRLRRMPHI